MLTHILHFLSPLGYPVGFLWLVMVASTLFLLKRRNKLGAGLLGGLVILLWGMGTRGLTDGLIASLESPYVRGGVADLPKCDAVVMLGGGYRLSTRDPLGIDVSDAGDRLLTAFELMRQKKAPSLVLGGSLSEAGLRGHTNALHNVFLAWGASPEAMFDLGLCMNTHDEALHLGELMRRQGWHRVLLVTSAYHMKRSEATFQKVGVEVIPVACDFQRSGVASTSESFKPFPGTGGLQQLELYLHEKIGWWIYRWRGWI